MFYLFVCLIHCVLFRGAVINKFLGFFSPPLVQPKLPQSTCLSFGQRTKRHAAREALSPTSRLILYRFRESHAFRHAVSSNIGHMYNFFFREVYISNFIYIFLNSRTGKTTDRHFSKTVKDILQGNSRKNLFCQQLSINLLYFKSQLGN